MTLSPSAKMRRLSKDFIDRAWAKGFGLFGACRIKSHELPHDAGVHPGLDSRELGVRLKDNEGRNHVVMFADYPADWESIMCDDHAKAFYTLDDMTKFWFVSVKATGTSNVYKLNWYRWSPAPTVEPHSAFISHCESGIPLEQETAGCWIWNLETRSFITPSKDKEGREAPSRRWAPTPMSK